MHYYVNIWTISSPVEKLRENIIACHSFEDLLHCLASVKLHTHQHLIFAGQLLNKFLSETKMMKSIVNLTKANMFMFGLLP